MSLENSKEIEVSTDFLSAKMIQEDTLVIKSNYKGCFHNVSETYRIVLLSEGYRVSLTQSSGTEKIIMKEPSFKSDLMNYEMAIRTGPKFLGIGNSCNHIIKLHEKADTIYACPLEAHYENFSKAVWEE